MNERIHIEDVLKHFLECEQTDLAPTVKSVAGALQVSPDEAARLLDLLERSERVLYQDGGHRLSLSGREYAMQILRAHRLYETFLARATGVRGELWHSAAEKVEHKLTQQDADELDARLGFPRFDPHGDPIPYRGGDLQPTPGTPLPDLPAGFKGRIVHVEDEPPRIYAKLAARNLAPGTLLQIASRGGDGIRVEAEGQHYLLSPEEAINLSLNPLEKEETLPPSLRRLSDLAVHEKAILHGLSPACRGEERRRLLDLGLVPGTSIHISLRSPSGNPTAYMVRGSTLALRTEQAERILIVEERREEERMKAEG